MPAPSSPALAPPRPPGRERQSRLRHRQLILDAACSEFAARGFSACQTLDIAQQAGVPKANLYYYFHTKENLYAEVLKPLLEPLRQASALLSASAMPTAALGAYIAARLQIIQAYPLRSKILCSELLHGAQQLPATWREALQAQHHNAIACLRNWMGRGLIQPVAPEHLLLFIDSATQTYPTLGWQIALIRGSGEPTDDDFQDVARTLTQMVLAGIGVTPGICLEPAPVL